MASKWSFGSVPIFVSDEETNREIKRAELFPLDSTSSKFQFFGAGSRHYSIKGLITSGSYLTDLENYAIANSPQTFVTPWETLTNCYIHKDVKSTTVKYAGGVVDGVSLSVNVDQLLTVEFEVIQI